MDIRGIIETIPHRYPLLLVDRVLSIEPRKRIHAYKNVSFNEPFFQRHFPGAPVMPGVLILEALAQAGAVLLLSDLPDRESKLVFFTGIDGARFRQIVTPGDRLDLKVEVIKLRATICKMRGRAEVDGKLCAEADVMCALVDKSGKRRTGKKQGDGA